VEDAVNLQAPEDDAYEVTRVAPFLSHMPTLTPEAEVAVLARALHREGFADHNNGHITVLQEDGSFLVTPFEFPWDEVCPGDIMRMDSEGKTLAGRWTITDAIELHLEVHRERRDVVVAVHNHPHYTTVWAAAGRVPEPFDQLSAMVDDDDVLIYSDYAGPVSSKVAAKSNVKAMGSKHIALLQNHGAFVLGTSISETYFRCIALEWRSRLAWEVAALGGGSAVKPEARVGLSTIVRQLGGSIPGWWEAAVRREIRRDSSLAP
jgi:ribulose-5-phosphate 4-epimerase/fuculose-1-phosphate aldolase